MLVLLHLYMTLKYLSCLSLYNEDTPRSGDFPFTDYDVLQVA